MGVLLQDLRFAGRMLSRNRGFTVAVLLVTALGIGANSTIFCVINAALIRPFPWKDPDRIVYVFETNRKLGLDRQLVSPANFFDWKDQSKSFEQTAAWRFLYFNITGRDEPERVQGLIVDANFFPLLGVEAEVGRTFLPEEDQPGKNKVVVMSFGLWQRRFGADPNLIGGQITVEGEPNTVVGILPRHFKIFHVLNRELDLYQPLALDRGQSNREDHAIWMFARLKPNVTIEQAQAEMSAIYRRLEQAHPAANSGWEASVLSLTALWTEKSRSILLLLLAAVGLVLLIACANVANLMLARATARRKEIAVRMALGASSVRVIRQLLTESALLALLGGALGLLVSLWAVSILDRLVPYTAINRMGDFHLDAKVLAFTILLSLLTGMIFGLAPAVHSSRLNLNESLKEGTRSSSEGIRAGGLRNGLVISEVALSAILLIGATLMISSSLRLQGIYRGLNPNNVLTMQIWLPEAKYTEGRRVAGFFRELLDRVETIPGIESAGAVNFPPLALQYLTVPFTIEGQAPQNREEMPVARCWIVSPQYFRTMSIPLLTGRQLTEQDFDETRGVVVISESMARRFWRAENPIGRRIKPQFPNLKAFWLPESSNLPVTVVGVVGDVRLDRLADRDLPQIYLPYSQNPSSIMNLVVRTPSDPMRWVSAVRKAVYEVDKDQPIFDAKTMEDVVADSFSAPKTFASLLLAFAVFALVLASAGVYTVMAYSVAQRTREIGIRMALGADSTDVLKLVLGRGLRLALTGVAIGLIGAFVAARIMSSLLFGVSATDSATFVSMTLILTLVCMAACCFPARRAMKVDPISAIRHE